MLTGSMGFSKVFHVKSIEDMFRQLRRSPSAKLLMVDFDMPHMRSVVRLHELRREFPNVHLAVLSPSGRREDILMALEGGAHGYLPTSLESEEITGALETIMAGGIYVPPSIAQLGATRSGSAEAGHAGQGDAMSPRQRQVMELVAEGKPTKLIATELRLSEGTVKSHIAAGFRKMGVHNRARAAAIMSHYRTA